MSGYVFGRGSNVLEYWLVNAEGFVVRSRGARVGVVRDVVIDPARGRASALVLRSRFTGRRRTVLARDVAAVDPAERLLEVEVSEPAGPSRSERARAAGAAFLRWSAAVDRRFEAAGAWLRPRLRAWALAAAADVRSYVRDVRTPDLYDRKPKPRARPGVRVGARRRPRG